MTTQLASAIWQQTAFWLAFLAMYAMEARLRAHSLGREDDDRNSRLHIGFSLMAGLALGWILSALPWLRWHSAGLHWAGIGLMIAGLLLRFQSVRALGGAFTLHTTVEEEQRLVQTGPYRYLRHPSYSGVCCWLVGIGLTFGNLPALLAVVALPLLWGYRYRMRVEEAVLLNAWGEAYRDYMRRTYRLIPFVW